MDRTQQIKDAHPWLSYDEVVKVLLYHHQGSSWIQNLKSDKLERSMEAFSKLLNSNSRKDSFEKRWHKAREILLTSK